MENNNVSSLIYNQALMIVHALPPLLLPSPLPPHTYNVQAKNHKVTYRVSAWCSVHHACFHDIERHGQESGYGALSTKDHMLQ